MDFSSRQLVSGVLAGLLLVLGGCVAVHPWFLQATGTTLTSDRIELPTKLKEGKLYVEARVNGSGPYWFLVDTGAGGLVLAPHVVREARLKARKNAHAPMFDAHGNKWEAASTRVSRLEISGLTVEGIHAIVQAEEERTRANTTLSDGGIIGIRVFLDVVLELDFEKSVVAVSRAGAIDFGAQGAIPYEEICPTVTVKVGGKPVRSLVDSGAQAALVLPHLADWPLLFTPVKADGYSMAVGGFERPTYAQLVDDVQIGPITHRNLLVLDNGGRSAVLGTSFFDRWKVVVDQQRKLLWILGAPLVGITEFEAPRHADGRPKTLGLYWVPEGKYIRIREVDANSRAEQFGLRAGDLLVAIEGEEPFIYWARESAPIQRWRLQRGSEELEITLTDEAFKTDS